MSDDTEAALLAAIRAAPDDDAPRLVYADWLTERGDPRGEYIALACAFAKSHDAEVRRRADALEKAHKSAWLARLPVWARAEATLARGFVSRITVADLDTLFERASEIVALTPVPRVIAEDFREALFSADQTRVLVKTVVKDTWSGGYMGNSSMDEGEDTYVVYEVASRRRLLRHVISWWWMDGSETKSDRPRVTFRADGRALVLRSDDGTVREVSIP
jgi:uncharacterized protein (TIGR02996 family)